MGASCTCRRPASPSSTTTGPLTRIVGVSVDVTARQLGAAERVLLLEPRTGRAPRRRTRHVARRRVPRHRFPRIADAAQAILGWAQILQTGARTPDPLQSGWPWRRHHHSHPVARAAGRGCAAGGPAETRASASDPATGSVAHLTVLVVDNDHDSRQVLAQFPGTRGARVLTVASADEALVVLRRERPDVRLADLGMPDRDGFELIRAVRHLPAHELVRPEDSSCAPAGFQSHLPKPVNRDELLTLVARLHRSRSRA